METNLDIHQAYFFVEAPLEGSLGDIQRCKRAHLVGSMRY